MLDLHGVTPAGVKRVDGREVRNARRVRAPSRVRRAALHPVPARACVRDGAARDARRVPDRQPGAGRSGAGHARRPRGVQPGDRRRVSRQVGPRSAAVAAVLDLPAAAVPRRPRHLDHAPSGRCSPTSRNTRRRRSSSARIAFLLVAPRSASRSASSPPCGATAGSTMRRGFISLIGVSSPMFWLAFIMLTVFYGGLQIAPGPGRLDPIDLPPPTVTGLYLIDSALAGDWDTFHDALAHLVLPSIVLARGDARPDHPHDARQHAGDAAPGLRARRARQGHEERAHHHRPRAAQRADPGGHARRPRLRQPADRHGDDRDDLLLAGPRPLHVPQRRVARLSRHHGHDADLRDRLPDHQPAGRPISYALLDPRVVR